MYLEIKITAKIDACDAHVLDLTAPDLFWQDRIKHYLGRRLRTALQVSSYPFVCFQHLHSAVEDFVN